MRKIEIHERGVTNIKAGLVTGETGIVDFPDDPKFDGWLAGQEARGALTVLKGGKKAKQSEADNADQEAAAKTQHPDGEPEAEPATEEPAAYAATALGPTSGAVPETSGPGASDAEPVTLKEPQQVHADGAEGLTIGSTPGPAPVEPDLEKDLADANATQHPEKKTTALRGKPGAKPKRGR